MQEELHAMLVEHYPFTIHRIRPFPQGWELETGHGHFLLQSHPVAFRQKEGWLKRVFQSLSTESSSDGVDRVDRGGAGVTAAIHPVADGSHGFEFADRYYYLTGRLPILAHRLDPPILAGSLASFHRTTADALQGVGKTGQQNGKWPRIWQRQIDLFEYYRGRMDLLDEQQQKPIVQFMLYNFTYLCQLGETATTYWNHADCQEAYGKSMGFNGIAYGNFDGSQAVLCAGGQVQFVHPYSWVDDVRARDIAQYIKNDVYLHGWQPDRTVEFIQAYHNDAPLTEGEFTLIYNMLLWPGKWIKWAEPTLGKRNAAGSETAQLPAPEMLEQALFHHEIMLREFPALMGDQFGINLPGIPWLVGKK